MESGENRQSRCENFLLAHWGDLYRLALGIGYDEESAECLVHTILLAGADNLHQFNTPSEAKLWLVKLMIQFPAEALGNDERHLQGAPTLDDLRSPKNSAFPQELDPLFRSVQQGLQQLKGEQRLIVLLTILEKRSCEDIASILKTPESAVRRELGVGLMRFHACMDMAVLETSLVFKEAFHSDR